MGYLVHRTGIAESLPQRRISRNENSCLSFSQGHNGVTIVCFPWEDRFL